MGACCCGGTPRGRFSFEDIPDLSHKVAIVTGASSGIGLVTARELARKGCHVIMACRSKEKTMTAVHQLAKTLPDIAKLDFMELDLMRMDSILAFVEMFKRRNLPLHILINNAGVMACPFRASEDGLESQFATNHVGHHALTVGLLPVLEASAPSRVVVVSSRAHRRAHGIDFADLHDEDKYQPWKAYSQSKLANVLFARELSRQLELRQVHNVYVNVVHPGMVQTEVTTHQHWLMNCFVSWFQLDVDDGAKTQLYVATSDDIIVHNWHGEYFVPIARLSSVSSHGRQLALARRLWAYTEALIEEICESLQETPEQSPSAAES